MNYPYQQSGNVTGIVPQRESTLQRIGESIIYSNDYAQSINRQAKSKQDYGDILRQQMKANEEVKQAQQQGTRKQFNNQQMQQQQQQQQPYQSQSTYSSINYPSVATPYVFNSINQQQQQQFQQPQQQLQTYKYFSDDYASSQASREPARNYRGSLLKEQLADSYFAEKELKQRAFAAGLAEQLNERRWERMAAERSKPIEYLPANEANLKNKAIINQKIAQIQEKINEPTAKPFELAPTNAFNTNSILYYEVNKNPSAYKWQPGGDWQRGRVDLEMLQFAYKKEEEEFSKSHMKLQEQTEIARRLRDDKHMQMMKLRERQEQNQKIRVLFGGNTTNNNNNNQQSTGLESSEVNTNDVNNINWKEILLHGVGYDSAPVELKHESRLVGMEYQMDYPLGSEGNAAVPTDNYNLEQVLENLYQEDSQNEEGVDNISSISKRPIQSQLLQYQQQQQLLQQQQSSQQQLPSQRQYQQQSRVNLNQSEFTEYNLLNQLEEHENDQNGIKNNNNKDRQVGGINDPPGELDISQIPLDPADNKPTEDAHLDISNIEERKEEESHDDELKQQLQQQQQQDQQEQVRIQSIQDAGKDNENNEGEQNPGNNNIQPQSKIDTKQLQAKIQLLSSGSSSLLYNQMNQQNPQQQQLQEQQDQHIEITNSPHGQLSSFPQRKRAHIPVDKDKLDNSGDEFKEIDGILEDIGDIMRNDAISSERSKQLAQMQYEPDQVVQQMQLEKQRIIGNINNSVEEYNLGRNNPYLNGGLKSSERHYRKGSNQGLNSNRDDFDKVANNVDLLISQLVQEREIF